LTKQLLAALIVLSVSRRHLAAVLTGVSLALPGCGDDSDRFSEVEYGMSEAQVREIMGQPDIVRHEQTGATCWGWGSSKDPPRGPESVACFEAGKVSFLIPQPSP
jgi:hypothetical protein